MLSRVGLLRETEAYTSTPFLNDEVCKAKAKLAKEKPAVASLLVQAPSMNPHEQILAKADSPANALEYFSLLRQQLDVTAEYHNYEQLRRMRSAYILHILDQILSERQIVAFNDIKEAEEAEEEAGGQRVTLDNVFELAKQGASGGAQDGDPSDEESDDSEGEEGATTGGLGAP